MLRIKKIKWKKCATVQQVREARDVIEATGRKTSTNYKFEPQDTWTTYCYD